MLYDVKKASDWNYETFNVEINTIEDLQELSLKYGGYQLIIGFSSTEPNPHQPLHNPWILIYDDYIE